MNLLDELVLVLGIRGEVGGGELVKLLGISQPTLSRLIATAGDRICRMGRTRAARYALTRSIPRLGTRVPVRQVDENGKVRLFGIIQLLANGRHWLERNDGKAELFEGLPPFASDMSPQGYIGRNFPAAYPDLELPQRIVDWNDDHRLIAIARHGEDCVGNLVVGDESFSRFLAKTPQSVRRDEYPEFALRSLEGQPGSSAGGEQPKFAVYSEGRHVLVKFAGGDTSQITTRWKDLLACEHVALEALRAAGIDAATADLLDINGMRFLEVERFDRLGARGRKGLLSLLALASEYLGQLESWTKASADLLSQGRINGEDARKMRWLDTFGQLIGNTDRHFGNLSFFEGRSGSLQLAPVYDMLPMLFAPQTTIIVERRYDPSPPTAENYEVWSDAACHALAYWNRLSALDELSIGFRQLCSRCHELLKAVVSRVPGI